MRIKFIHVLFTVALFLSCEKTTKIGEFVKVSNLSTKNNTLSEEERKYWHHKDILEDTIPGISLEKTYKKLIGHKKGKEVIVAVIDTKLDIHHEDITKNIWKNPKEISNNQIDDDKNGYVDDINGWNFLGNFSGEDIMYSNFESMRIIRKYDSVFNIKFEEKNVEEEYKEQYSLYKKAKILRGLELKQVEKDKKYGNFLFETYPKSKKVLQKFFPNENYTIPQLDSLYNTYKKDSLLAPLIYYMADYKKYNLNPKWIDNYKKSVEARLTTSLNFDYNERTIIGDNPENLGDIKYGNNKVWNDSLPFQHAINVAGVLAADSKNNKGTKGIFNSVRIMSLSVASSGGDEHDKDISLAIRYAVDNGAQIINMSFGKPISMNKKWVDEAIQYADSKDVLIVSSAGNDNKELNPENSHYPNDYDISGKEISNNVIVVGSISKTVNKNFKSYFSNYSKEHVDIYAPGHEIYTTVYNNEYGFISGTSLAAPIVSGIAALIRSYYPDLSVAQVKEILMKSGVSYNIDIEIKQKDGTKKLVPFSELSKSGKVVNAYNALLMAEQVSKSKN
ncbi:S8 family serine peptidase [Aquimarina megaterium]|uniref:S8 family serine peptidase n=1 Tax=Aquimarina megaterium TaxID=1443666 RepID=UPI000945B5F7|nr:S8 family serine peptidase [Aquimarina megaterium]